MKRGSDAGFKEVLAAQLSHVQRILLEEHEASINRIRKDLDGERCTVSPVQRSILKQPAMLNGPVDVSDASDAGSEHAGPARVSSDSSQCQSVDIGCWSGASDTFLKDEKRSQHDDFVIRPPSVVNVVPQPPTSASPVQMIISGPAFVSGSSETSSFKGDENDESGHCERLSTNEARLSTNEKPVEKRTSFAPMSSKKSFESVGTTGTKSRQLFVVLVSWQNQQRSIRAKKKKQSLPSDGTQSGWSATRSATSVSASTSAFTAQASDLLDEKSTLNSRFAEALSSFWTLHPHSDKRFVWELFALILVMYDIAMVPLDFFDPPRVTIVVVMAWVIRIFWTFDLVANVLTGYIDQTGTVVMQWSMILKHYARTWLLFDTTVLAFNWIELGYDTAMGATPRSLRVLRMFRLIRFIRASSMMQVVTEHFSSDKVITMLGISKIMVFIIALTHCIACLFYGLSMSQTDDVGWVEVFKLQRASLVKRYLHSFHWSLTQFTGPDTEMQPQSEVERTFNILVLLFAFVVSAGFVSSITTSMTRLELTGDTQTAQFRALHRYLCDNHISGNLVARVQRNVQHIVSERNRNINEREVDLLQLVSAPLRAELHFEIYMPVLRHHAHFRRANDVAHLTMQAICHDAVRPLSLLEGDVLFHDDEMSPHPSMYVLVAGQMFYATEAGTVDLYPNDWLSEANLWTDWAHAGNAVAKKKTRLLAVDSGKFQSTAARFRTEHWRPELYACEFVDELNRVIATGKEPTDLHDSGMDYDRAVAVAFGEKVEGHGGALLKRASTTFTSRPKMVRKLTTDLFGVLKEAAARKVRVSANNVATSDEEDH